MEEDIIFENLNSDEFCKSLSSEEARKVAEEDIQKDMLNAEESKKDNR